MCVRDLVLHDVLDVLAAILQDQVASARVVVDKGGDVVHLCTNRDIAALLRVVCLDFSGRDGGKRAGGHGESRRDAEQRLGVGSSARIRILQRDRVLRWPREAGGRGGVVISQGEIAPDGSGGEMRRLVAERRQGNTEGKCRIGVAVG
jgi:hypothetical protein